MNFVPSLLIFPPLFPSYGRQNNGPPKISSLNTQNLCYLTREKDFMRDDKIKGLGMGRRSWISRWTLSAVTCILIRGRRREIWTHTGEDYETGREICRCWPWVLGWCHHKPRNTRNPPELEEARNGFSHRASWGSVALPTLLWLWYLVLDSHLQNNKFLFVVIYYGSNRKLTHRLSHSTIIICLHNSGNTEQDWGKQGRLWWHLNCELKYLYKCQTWDGVCLLNRIAHMSKKILRF